MPVSVVIPSQGTIDEHGDPLLAGALAAVNAPEVSHVVVVTTNGRLTQPGRDAVEHLMLTRPAQVVNVDADPFNFSRAINAGVAATSTDQVLLLNDDVALPRSGSPDWVARLAARKGDVKGVMLLQPDEKTIEHAGVWFTAPGGMPCHIGQYNPLPSPAAPRDSQYQDGPQGATTGAVMMVSRRAFDRLHGFDERFPLNYNDVDFCLRAHERGMKVHVYNTIRLIHRESSTRGWSMPTEADFHLLARQHRQILRRNGVVVDEFAASRFRRQLIEQRQAQGLPV
jgi:GT2 family glycosyltransferase